MTGTMPAFAPADPADGSEIAAFRRLLPALRADHGGDFVALRGGRVIARGGRLDDVCREAARVAPSRAVYCGYVDPFDGGPAFFGRFEMPAEVA